MVEASEAKAGLLQTELKSLRSSIPCQDDRVETLNKSLEELHAENVGLKEKIVTLFAHESNLKIKWEKEHVTDKIAHERKQFKRLIPQKMA